MACIKTKNDIVASPSAPSARLAIKSSGHNQEARSPYIPPSTPVVSVDLSVTNRSLTSALRSVRQATFVAAVRQAVADATQALVEACGRGASASELRMLEGGLRSLQREAASKITSLGHEDAIQGQREPFVSAAAQDHNQREPHTPSLIDQVLAARAAQVDILSLLSAAMQNPRIPEEIRSELPNAMAKVQEISAHAPGITTVTVNGVELGASSPPGSGGKVWTSTVASGGHAHGFAYEMIATARFIDMPRTPGNGGKSVQIVKGRDELLFGVKLPAGPDRRTVEADTLIVRAGGHKIGIDSKAYSRPFGVGSDLRKELEGIKHAIRQGEVHEFHFASRGPLTRNAKDLIEQVDLELRRELLGRATPASPTISDLQAMRLDLSQPLICWHESLG